jgi:hypothetical protein
MFHRHFDDYIHHSHGGPGHHGFGRGPFRGWRSRGGGSGGREGRMFDGGELKFVILALVAEKPATATRSSRSSASGSGATIRQARASSIRR